MDYQADSVRSRILASLGDINNIRYIWRKLQDYWLRRHRLDRFCNLGSRFRISSEAHSAAVYVRAGHIDLKPADLLLSVEFFAGVSIVINRKSAYICHYRFVEAFFKLRKLIAYNLVNARILESDGIYHACRALGDSRCGIAESRILCCSLE